MAKAVLDYAEYIQTDITQFNKILSSTDTTVQKALETLNDYEPDLSDYLQSGDNISELVNDANYLTVETDPVFTAHPAHSIDSGDIVNLGNLSGTNTGDQDLSGLLPKSDVDTDTTLAANSDTKVASQKAIKTYVDALVSGTLVLQGAWDASTNTPDITGTTTTGYAWRVSVTGSTNLGGITTWSIGDLAVKTSTGWLRVANQDVAAVWGNISGDPDDQSEITDIIFKGFTIGDGASGIILNTNGTFWIAPWDGKISAWKIWSGNGDSNTIEIDVLKNGTTIGQNIDLSAQASNEATGLSISFSAGDIFSFNVDANTDCKRAIVEFLVRKT